MATLSDALELDRQDALAPFRSQFFLEPGTIYLNGNSLGLLSKPAETAILAMLEQWKRKAGAAWMDVDNPWFDFSERVSARLAPLVGAGPGELIATGSTTVNLHQLLATFYQPDSHRSAILIDQLAFPTDAYAVQSHVALRGFAAQTHVRKVVSRDGATLAEDDIIAELQQPGLQMAILPAVVYVSGQLIDLERITQAAKSAGVLIGWDCSHAIGAIPLNFRALDADFAFWCSYKYLNAGPGAVGGLWINPRHAQTAPGMAGWFGSDKQRQFLMQHTFEPAAGAGRFQLGSPHLLSAAALMGSVQLFEEAGMDALRQKSLALTDFLIESFDAHLRGREIQLITPREHSRRGGHIALQHAGAEQLCKTLGTKGIITDYRRPGVLRITPSPLYNSFEDCYRAIDAISAQIA